MSCETVVIFDVFGVVANSADGPDAGGQSSAVTDRQSAGRGPRGRGSHRGTFLVYFFKSWRTMK